MTHQETASAHDLIESRIGVLLSLLVTIIVCVWVGSSESDSKYAIYALPGLMMLTCAVLMRWRISVELLSFRAFLVYAFVAVVSTLVNSYSAFATRDLLIVAGYLLLFTVAVRAPVFVADACLVSLTFATGVVAVNRGFGDGFDFLSSAGILESPLAFPLGILFLYFAGARQWGRAALAFLLFFLAFKRIAIASAVLVLAIEFALALLGQRRIGRLLAAVIVVTASVVSLYLLEIFAFVAHLLNDENLSANSISLGRSDLAAILAKGMHDSGLYHQLLGFGPGSADALLDRTVGSSNPHNDWLKIYFDYGLVGFVGFHVVLYLIHPNTALGNRLYIFLAIVMCTDNVLIYVFYFVYLFLILRIHQPPGSTDTAIRRPASLRQPSGVLR